MLIEILVVERRLCLKKGPYEEGLRESGRTRKGDCEGDRHHHRHQEEGNEEVGETKEEDDNKEEIQAQEFNLVFQNPSYILEKDLIKNEYFCDPEKEICKIIVLVSNTKFLFF